MAAHKATHCPHGHEYAVVGRWQNRRCAECGRQHAREFRNANAERLRPIWRETKKLDRAYAKGVIGSAR